MAQPLPHRKRLIRRDEPGQARFLTFSCFHRLPLLSKDRTRTWLVEAIATAKTRFLFELWAWVIMPEHAHLLVYPKDGRVEPLLNSIKKITASRSINYLKRNAPRFLSQLSVKRAGKTAHRFWQAGGGWDENITEAVRLHEVIEYIHNNPVKRGLVARPEDWYWSSARAWSDGVDEPLAIDRTLPLWCEFTT